jgi:hypothetical protein
MFLKLKNVNNIEEKYAQNTIDLYEKNLSIKEKAIKKRQLTECIVD